jgi:hypothetical protein
MAGERRKEFGRRGAPPPVITHAPHGLAGAPVGPSTRRKRTLTISLVTMGSLAIGGFALMEALHRRTNCPPDQANPDQSACANSSSHGGSGGHGWGGGSSRASSTSSSSSSHAVSFGGFGGHGAAHGGGS